MNTRRGIIVGLALANAAAFLYLLFGTSGTGKSSGMLFVLALAGVAIVLLVALVVGVRRYGLAATLGAVGKSLFRVLFLLLILFTVLLVAAEWSGKSSLRPDGGATPETRSAPVYIPVVTTADESPLVLPADGSWSKTIYRSDRQRLTYDVPVEGMPAGGIAVRGRRTSQSAWTEFHISADAVARGRRRPDDNFNEWQFRISSPDGKTYHMPFRLG